jgi:hypothetical protein
MITKLDGSAGSVVGYAMSGTIEPADYDVLVPEMRQLLSEYGTVQLLCDLTDFHSEDPAAWLSDLRFGRDFHEGFSRMAIVGDSRLDELVAHLAKPFYAQQAKCFPERAAAWAWLREA